MARQVGLSADGGGSETAGVDSDVANASSRNRAQLSHASSVTIQGRRLDPFRARAWRTHTARAILARAVLLLDDRKGEP
jgi:hypothetical protein